jgi:hypothetical protein
MAERRLIINADDFGICSETNRAIRELFSAKLITSTSLLLTAESSLEAVEIIKEDKLNFGLHLTLNSDFNEYPWQCAYKGQSSLNDGNGCLFADTEVISKNAKYKDLIRECEAQFEMLSEFGITPDHFDNHSGTMYGINLRPFFIIAFKLSKKMNLPFRFPKRNTFLKDYFSGKVPWYITLAHKMILGTAKMCRATLIDDMISNPFSIKDISSYEDLEKYYMTQVLNIKEGVTEMFLHPSYSSDKYMRLTPEWQKREYELKFLMSGKLHDIAEKEGIEIISYKDI